MPLRGNSRLISNEKATIAPHTSVMSSLFHVFLSSVLSSLVRQMEIQEREGKNTLKNLTTSAFPVRSLSHTREEENSEEGEYGLKWKLE